MSTGERARSSADVGRAIGLHRDAAAYASIALRAGVIGQRAQERSQRRGRSAR
jgi:hypothetical protein